MVHLIGSLFKAVVVIPLFLFELTGICHTQTMKSSVYALQFVVRSLVVLGFGLGWISLVTGCSEEGVASTESTPVPDVVEDTGTVEEEVAEE